MSIRVYRNAAIHTGDGGRPPARAMAVEGERLLAVGAEAEVREAAGPAAELIDLEGAAVLPGLYDAHIHTAQYAQSLGAVDLRDVRSLDDALARVAAHAARLRPGAWLFGGRWNSNTWDPPAQPDRYALDSVCPELPVALPNADGHTVWANSAALRLAGIDAGTPDPIGGEIVRDANGEPTGILRESASYPLRDLMVSADLRDRLRAAQEELLALGLTSVHDIDGEDCRDAYLQLRAAGELKLRVHKAIPMDHLEAAVAEGRRTGQGDDWFRTGPVKIFSDGALGSHTCHMSEPFAGEQGNAGIAVTPYDDLVTLFARAAGAGIAVATHAIGDQANHLVLDAYEAIGRSARLRHRIEHAQHLRPGDLPRMAGLGVVASMQPVHCTSDIDLVDSLLAGRELASYAWRGMLDAGVALAFGSDAPIEHPNPFAALYAAVTRTRPDGTPAGGWQPGQRLTMAEAVAAHTVGAAYAAGEEHDKGVLAPGRLADFIAVDTDPYREPAEAVLRTKVLTTVVGGDVRWRRV
ncbi:amidohydrolase [Actinoallomurus rhizosphaericola]|uniref:amidohydrolase n=1 Tax=Actinoallomurus rhizosphaericola TaxID=2952536 RepID=UPI002093E40C|nr:amidohydrolase [Actinoallomurus rhizosphaericola]MCO5997993.1 amidohydrolase [Actinoallomurus rhizosphaericola]